MKGTDHPLQLQTPALSAAGPLSHSHAPIESLYLHIPFCFHKCHYCDFYSFVDRQDRQEAFTNALLDELRTLAPHAACPVKSIFIGGGTPTLLRVELWEQLLGTIMGEFELDAESLEFTVECNPETATPELMATLRAGGVNRLSIGAQSFNPDHLKTLERWHDPANVERALRLAHEAGIKRLSLDLIFGVPGQSLDQWRADLQLALSMPPAIEHLSCYCLTYEPNTAMTQRLRAGEFQACDEDLEAQMYELSVTLTREAGLERYEVSNFARAGAECRHNLAYWRSQQWLAAGPSASAHVGGHRWKNVPRLGDWMAGVERLGGYSPIIDHEPPDAKRALCERLMMGLRLREGVCAAMCLEAARSLGMQESLETCALQQVEGGLMTMTDDRWVLTDRGILQADGITAEMMAELG